MLSIGSSPAVNLRHAGAQVDPVEAVLPALVPRLDMLSAGFSLTGEDNF
jgi:hypothetical protein